MRTPPPPPPALQWKARKHDDRQYRFLTYVFGGGVKVKDHEKHGDPVTPIRVASIRGQLRFWWRACNPSRCETVEELRRREGEIWGATGQASKVEITVLSQPSSPQTLHVFKYNHNHRLTHCEGTKDIAYGAFPLQPKVEAQQGGTGAQPWPLFDYGNATFSLRFTYPEDCRTDVQAALWAWETFGGLGGRTRRGFGAIARVNSPSSRNVEAELAVWRENPRIEGVPSLHHARFALASRSKTTSIEAWKDGLRLLRQMRQEAGFGRKSSQDPQKPGRSLWPEPDEIRRLTGDCAPHRTRPVTTVSRFPRAVFGMPIVFHFKDNGDPNMDLQLRPVDAERFASPLIIRPIADARGFRAAALVFSSQVPDAALVVGKAPHRVDWTLDPSLARDIQPLKRNGKVYTDPLELFLSELKK